MSSASASNLTSGFIDLATYDEQEKYMYGGSNATAYFVRDTVKSTWFTQVPVVLSRNAGTPAFGQDWSVSISRAGDYMLHAWLRVTFPEITPVVTGDQGIRWTRNLMHNIVKECSITFNDLVAARLDSYHLDFWSAFTVPAGKRNGYANMIGSIDELIQPAANGVPLPAVTLNLPIPLFFGRDSGVSLPTAALPYNEMRINFTFRDWTELLVLDDSSITGAVPSRVPTLAEVGGSAPTLGSVQVWANYAIVSNEERKRMGCAPRDILIEQVQTAPKQTFSPATNSAPSFDIRFSHAIKVVFFAARNTTVASDWSNYTAAAAVPSAGSTSFNPSGGVDPILQTSLVYENTNRLSSMGSDYFSLVNPWYHSPVIPMETGYHSYSYSLDYYNLDPMGSTNFGKLSNVSIAPEASEGAILSANGTGAGSTGTDHVNTFDHITTVINNNVIRISGGALGFPVL
ncbi:MAG: hypothetical protein JKX76_01295 [Colwellia sp.]|nr:hypothetical protein [Colwellia sp.]